MRKWIQRTAAILAAAVIQLYAAVGYYARELPDHYYVGEQQSLQVSTALHIAAQEQPTAGQTLFSETGNEAQTVSLNLFGFIPIKEVEVESIRTPMLVPCGQPFGIKMLMDGVMIVKESGVQTETGVCCPAADAGLQEGDILHSVNGTAISSNQALREQILQSNGQALTIAYTRNNTPYTTTLQPVASAADGSYTAGIWVRDSTAGIGTLTFYNPETNAFGGLGHPICDSDTGELMPLSSGEASPVQIEHIIKGKEGTPGMLQGTFSNAPALGTLLCNNSCGIFGTLSGDCPSQTEAVPMGFKQEIETGAAEILCTLSGTQPKRYSISIEEINLQDSGTQNMVIRVTDPELLRETGGIVQGMSGSPILQNGKLIGAVTHVFVDDPTCGYAIFCENMYRYGGAGAESETPLK